MGTQILRGIAPNFLSISVAAKWLHGSRYATSYGARPRPRRLCVRWGPSPPPQKGTEPPLQFSAHFYCGQTAGCIKMPLSTDVGLKNGHNYCASTRRGAKYCDECVCMSVCPLSYLKNDMSKLRANFLLTASVAGSCFDESAISYVLVVLWLTSCLHMRGHMARGVRGVYSKSLTRSRPAGEVIHVPAAGPSHGRPSTTSSITSSAFTACTCPGTR